MRLLKKKRVLLPVSLVAALVVSAAAFAAWTATGSGTGTATAASAQALTIASSDVTGLFPTGSVDLPVTITNPNPYAVLVTDVYQTAGQSIATTATGCDASAVSFNAASGQNLNLRVAGNGGTAQVTLHGAVSMSNAALDACQGAQFSVPLSLTGASTS
jgi:hypothetical protein